MSSLRHSGSGVSAPRTPRDDYLDAARSLILDVGWRRTTMTEIARRAGVSRMTIYRSWPDMDRLLGDLMTREWSTVVGTVADLDNHEHDWLDRLVDGVCDTVVAMRDNELLARILEIDPEMVLPYLVERRGRVQDAIAELLVERIRAAQAAGAVRGGDPLLVARSLLLLAHGFTLSAHTMTGDGVELADLDAELRTVVRRALAP